MKTKSNIGQFELPDGSYTNDNQEKAEILNSYFASVFAVEGPEALPEFEDGIFAEPLTDIDINETNIAKAIDKLKASKSQGPDQIHPKLIIECKVSKVAKIRNRYNQVPHLTQDTNGKVTKSQKTPQTRAKRSALSQQVTTKHI